MQKPREYYSEMRSRKLMDGPQLALFIYITELSALAFAKPKSDLSDESKAFAGIPSIELRSKYVARRLALLNAVKDDEEMRFLDYVARWDFDLLQALDDKVLPYRYTKDTLRSALGDIMAWQKEHRRA